MDKEPGKLWFFHLETGGAKELSGIAFVRPKAKPEHEKALFAAIRSIKRVSDK